MAPLHPTTESSVHIAIIIESITFCNKTWSQGGSSFFLHLNTNHSIRYTEVTKYLLEGILVWLIFLSPLL